MSAAVMMSQSVVPTATSNATVQEVPRTRLRLTRRGRAVFTAFAAAPLIAWAFIVILGSGGAAAETEVLRSTAFEYVTVSAGESLWAIAESIAPSADPRVVIDEIIRLNGLSDAMVQPGQRLALPIVP